jgi:hypothetical protein
MLALDISVDVFLSISSCSYSKVPNHQLARQAVLLLSPHNMTLADGLEFFTLFCFDATEEVFRAPFLFSPFFEQGNSNQGK